MRDNPLLEPLALAQLSLRNRMVVAPMSRVSTAGDGVPTAAMARYYAEFAEGGFGLIVTEGTYTDHAHSQAYAKQPAIVTAEQLRAWANVVAAVHVRSGLIFLQLMHAGALVQGNRHRAVGVAPSAVQPKGRMLSRGYGGHGPFALPREMSRADIAEAVEGFAASAQRARAAGFDGVEVHGANGYLLDQFLTTYTNRRTDEYGGAVENRVRLLVEVVEAMHVAAGADFPVGVRISQVKVNDADYRWRGYEDARRICERLRCARPAYVHVSSEDSGWHEASFVAPEVSITGVARSITQVPAIANGGLHDPDVGAQLIRDGHADLVSLGHGALANPDWPRRLADGCAFEAFDPQMLRPQVTLANAERWRAAHNAHPQEKKAARLARCW
jgi:2,4-dienoyl-CoA reductase-like NADH-dependent reductase (Old Yellow Enzyme family)